MLAELVCRRTTTLGTRRTGWLPAGGDNPGSHHGRSRLRPWADVGGAAPPYAGGVTVEQVTATLTSRWRRAGYPDFAWWIPVGMDGFAIAAAVFAASQRDAQGATLPAAALMVVAILPWFAALAGFRIPWWIFVAVTLTASTVVIVRYPVDYDFALLVWVMLVGYIGSCENLK